MYLELKDVGFIFGFVPRFEDDVVAPEAAFSVARNDEAVFQSDEQPQDESVVELFRLCSVGIKEAENGLGEGIHRNAARKLATLVARGIAVR